MQLTELTQRLAAVRPGDELAHLDHAHAGQGRGRGGAACMHVVSPENPARMMRLCARARKTLDCEAAIANRHGPTALSAPCDSNQFPYAWVESAEGQR